MTCMSWMPMHSDVRMHAAALCGSSTFSSTILALRTSWARRTLERCRYMYACRHYADVKRSREILYRRADLCDGS
jgi:hypothetical protein